MTTWPTIASPAGTQPVPRCRAGLLDEPRERLVLHRLDVLAVLEHRPERLLDDLGIELLAPERVERHRPVDRLRDPRRLREVEAAKLADERRRLGRESLGNPGNAEPHDLDLALDRRVPDPVEQRPALERVVQLARPVRREDHRRSGARRDRPELGDRDLEVGEDLEQERLELLVGAVDLVDQEHDRLVAVDRLEQRPPDQVLGPEELLLANRALLRGADVEQLARVVPLVDGVSDVEALVALQADQPCAEHARERLRRLGLPDTGFALEENGLRQRERQVERGRETAVGQVVSVAKRVLQLVDRRELHISSVDHGLRQRATVDHRELPRRHRDRRPMAGMVARRARLHHRRGRRRVLSPRMETAAPETAGARAHVADPALPRRRRDRPAGARLAARRDCGGVSPVGAHAAARARR